MNKWPMDHHEDYETPTYIRRGSYMAHAEEFPEPKEEHLWTNNEAAFLGFLAGCLFSFVVVLAAGAMA